mgnify:CR=1 FL=1
MLAKKILLGLAIAAAALGAGYWLVKNSRGGC